MGGADKKLVVIPTAVSSDTLKEEYLNNFKNYFIKLGFTDVVVLHTRDRTVANSDEFIAPIKSASGVFFGGGRQWRFTDSYLSTKTHEAFKEVLKRGGVIAGSSAGATIQGSYLARGDTKANTIMMGDHEEGLGFMKNVAIDQHLLVRNRQFDMFEILDNKPELLGIGIDERNTAIVVQKDRFRVIGESYVTIYDGTRWSEERDTIYQLPKNSREFYFLKNGDEYDLKKRKVVEYKDLVFMKLSRDELKKFEGKYQLEGDSATSLVCIENDSLKAFPSWNKYSYQLLPETPNKFFIKGLNLYCLFEINEKNEVVSYRVPKEKGKWKKIDNK